MLPQGVQNAGILLTSQFPDLFEDFVACRDNLIITGNLKGMMEVFKYDPTTKKGGKVNQINITSKVRADNKLSEQITSLSLSKDHSMIAVSTCTNDALGEGRLAKIAIMSIDVEGKLTPKGVLDFGGNQPTDSLFTYISFSHVCAGTPVLVCFQSLGRRKVEFFALEGPKLKFVGRKDNYHKDDFVAIRALNDVIYSIDYEGNLHELNLSQI